MADENNQIDNKMDNKANNETNNEVNNEEKIFTIESDILEKLKPRFLEASKMISDAINEKRPIWIRHHNDCDGYSAALVLEKVILKRLGDFHTRESDVHFYYRRLPSRSPYYDYMDVTKDLASILDMTKRFNRKNPLMIVLDNGSSQEDLLSLKKLKIYEIPLIVIDHHPYLDENDEFIDVHINPLHHNEEYRLSAGMLCYELAEIFAKEESIDTKGFDLKLIAAMSGIADKIDGPEIEQYLHFAKNEGFHFDKLKEISDMISFELDFLNYQEARAFVDDLFFGDMNKINELIKIILPEIEQNIKKIQHVIDKNLEVVEVENEHFLIGLIETVETVSGNDLSRSRITSQALKHIEEKYGKPAVMLGYASDALTFRVSKSLEFDMNAVKRKLQDDMPYALVRGGGHPRAGSIMFAPKFKDRIMDSVKDYIVKKYF